MIFSGWVRTIYFYDLDEKHCFLKSSVNYSQCLNGQPHQSWVAVMKSGTIVTAHCSCMAGYVSSFVAVGAHVHVYIYAYEYVR